MSDAEQTLPLPDTDVTGNDAAARRRWPRIVLIVVVALVVLAVAAELIARAVVPGIVRSSVIENLDLPADQQLAVEVSGILLPQLIAGRFDELHLSSDQVTLGGVTGSADVTATGVPIRGGDLDAASGTVRLDAATLTDLLAGSDLPVDEVVLAEPNVTFGGVVEVLTLKIPVSVTVTPGVEEGDLLLSATEVSLGDATLDLTAVSGWLEDASTRLTGPHRICIADRLPAGLTLTELRVDGDEAVIGFDVDGAIATDPALLKNGTCG